MISVNTAKRIEKWDILKFILIFFVVMGHLIDNIYDKTDWMKSMFLFIYTFHMPVFIFISGLFCKKTVNEKKYDKIIGYLFLYYIAKIVIFLARLIAYGKLSFSAFEEGGLPWYMFAMFIFPLVTIAIRNISPRYVFVFFIILACFAGYDDKLDDLLSLQRLFVFYPFYFAGYCLEPNKVVEFLDKKYLKVISAVVIAVLALILFLRVDSCYWLRPLITGRHPYSKLGDNADFGALYRLAYYVVVFIVGAAVICITPNRIGSGAIARLGSRSLQVYVLHYFIIYVYAGFVGTNLFPNHPSVVIIGLSVIITLLCSFKFWEPLFNKILNPQIRKTE